jgi:hypothetical protein
MVRSALRMVNVPVDWALVGRPYGAKTIQTGLPVLTT